MRTNARLSLLAIIALPLLCVSGCTPAANGDERSESAAAFPRAERLVSTAGNTEFSTEAARDEAGEAEFVMDWAGI